MSGMLRGAQAQGLDFWHADLCLRDLSWGGTEEGRMKKLLSLIFRRRRLVDLKPYQRLIVLSVRRA